MTSIPTHHVPAEAQGDNAQSSVVSDASCQDTQPSTLTVDNAHQCTDSQVHTDTSSIEHMSESTTHDHPETLPITEEEEEIIAKDTLKYSGASTDIHFSLPESQTSGLSASGLESTGDCASLNFEGKSFENDSVPSNPSVSNVANQNDIVSAQRSLFFALHTSTCTVDPGCSENCISMKQVQKHISTCMDDCNCKTPHCVATRRIQNHWRICKNGSDCQRRSKTSIEKDRVCNNSLEKNNDILQLDRAMASVDSLSDSGLLDDPNDRNMDQEEDRLLIPLCRCIHHTEVHDPITLPVVESAIGGTVEEISDLYFDDKPSNDVWDMFMKQEPSMQPYIDSYKNSKWTLSKKKCCLERFFTFLSPPSALPSIMSSTHVPITQVHRKSKPEPNQLVYKTRAISHNVPYATAFAVDTTWHFNQNDDNSVNMKVYVDVVFLESCWIKAILRGTSRPPAVEGAIAVAKLVRVLSTKVEEMQQQNNSIPQSPSHLRPDSHTTGSTTSVNSNEGNLKNNDQNTCTHDSQRLYSHTLDGYTKTYCEGENINMEYKNTHDLVQADLAFNRVASPIGFSPLASDGNEADIRAHYVRFIYTPQFTPNSSTRHVGTVSTVHNFVTSTHLIAIENLYGDEQVHSDCGEHVHILSPSKHMPSNRTKMRRFSSVYTGNVSSRQRRIPIRCMSARYGTRYVRGGQNLVSLFDSMNDSEYKDIFGENAEMRVVEAAQFNVTHPEGLTDGGINEELDVVPLSIYDLPVSALIPVVISIPLFACAIYLWSRLADSLTTQRQLAHEWDTLSGIVKALSNESNNTHVKEAYESFGSIGADEFVDLLHRQAQAAVDAKDLLTHYFALVNDFNMLVVQERSGWGWVYTGVTGGILVMVLLVGGVISGRVVNAFKHPVG
eukprot:CFRG4863T1